MGKNKVKEEREEEIIVKGNKIYKKVKLKTIKQ